MGNKANRYTTVAQFYDFDADARMNKDIPFYTAYAEKIGAQHILDLCCGTGRVAIPLAKDGYNVTALDQSEAMLAVFKNKLGTLSGEVLRRIKIIEGDATDFTIKNQFDLCIIPYRSFQQFAHRVDAANCLKSVHKNLTPDGIFIISAIRPQKTLDEGWIYPKTKQWEIFESGQTITKYHWGEKIDVGHSRIHPVLCYEVKCGDNKEVFYEDLTLKYYYYDELVKMITDNGFKIIEEYGDYEGADIENGTEMIFVCQRVEL